MADNEVKVCDICASNANPHQIVFCPRCRNRREHTYCMTQQLRAVPDLWYCEACTKTIQEKMVDETMEESDDEYSIGSDISSFNKPMGPADEDPVEAASVADGRGGDPDATESSSRDVSTGSESAIHGDGATSKKTANQLMEDQPMDQSGGEDPQGTPSGDEAKEAAATVHGDGENPQGTANSSGNQEEAAASGDQSGDATESSSGDESMRAAGADPKGPAGSDTSEDIDILGVSDSELPSDAESAAK